MGRMMEMEPNRALELPALLQKSLAIFKTVAMHEFFLQHWQLTQPASRPQLCGLGIQPGCELGQSTRFTPGWGSEMGAGVSS